MSIWGVTPNFSEMMNVRSTEKPGPDLSNYKGPSFAQSLRGVAQSANLQVADGNAAATMNLRHNREEKLEKIFSFTEAEEDNLEESLARIKQLFEKLKK